jgi:hypothetical protein
MGVSPINGGERAERVIWGQVYSYPRHEIRSEGAPQPLPPDNGIGEM